MATTLTFPAPPYTIVAGPGDYDYVLLLKDEGSGQYAVKQLKPSYFKSLSNSITSLETNYAILNRVRGEQGRAVVTLTEAASEHYGNHDNPHGVTAFQLGLGKVANFGPASVEEVFEGERDDLVVTPKALGETLSRKTLALTRAVAETNNIAFGRHTLGNTQTQSYHDNMALGDNAGQSFGKPFDNAFSVGHRSLITGSYTFQAGDPKASVYTTQPLSHRADERDLAEVMDEALGLEFILALRPVMAKLDLREDYIRYQDRPVPPEPVGPAPEAPQMPSSDPSYQSALLAYLEAKEAWEAARDAYGRNYRKYLKDEQAWIKANRLEALTKDGSQTRTRQHHTFVAQEVEAASQIFGQDFAGYQDHTVNGGLDLKTVAPSEFIPPLVKAVQDLHTYVQGDAFVNRVAARLFELMQKPGQVTPKVTLAEVVLNQQLPGLTDPRSLVDPTASEDL